jgi:hypothetical protein
MAMRKVAAKPLFDHVETDEGVLNLKHGKSVEKRLNRFGSSLLVIGIRFNR